MDQNTTHRNVGGTAMSLRHERVSK